MIRSFVYNSKNVFFVLRTWIITFDWKMVKKKRPNKNAKVANVEVTVTSVSGAADVSSDAGTIEPMNVDVCGDTNNGDSSILTVNDETGDATNLDITEELNTSASERSVPIFKDPNFVHSSKSSQANAKKTRSWKNVKQIIATERTLSWGPDDVTYGCIDAPPSFKPAKKYSDVSGLVAKYTDPQTKLRYTTSDEYTHIRLLPADLVAGYLALRKATPSVP